MIKCLLIPIDIPPDKKKRERASRHCRTAIREKTRRNKVSKGQRINVNHHWAWIPSILFLHGNWKLKNELWMPIINIESWEWMCVGESKIIRSKVNLSKHRKGFAVAVVVGFVFIWNILWARVIHKGHLSIGFISIRITVKMPEQSNDYRVVVFGAGKSINTYQI